MTDRPAERRRNAVFAVLLGLGMLLRAEYLREFSTSPLFGFALGADVSEYYERAQAILNGVFTSASPDIHAPLYSWFLALELFLTGGSVAAVRGVQLALNLLWTPLFFALNLRLAAFVLLLILLAAVIATTYEFNKKDRTAAYLMLPYIAWLVFAGYLNLAAFILNG